MNLFASQNIFKANIVTNISLNIWMCNSPLHVVFHSRAKKLSFLSAIPTVKTSVRINCTWKIESTEFPMRNDQCENELFKIFNEQNCITRNITEIEIETENFIVRVSLRLGELEFGRNRLSASPAIDLWCGSSLGLLTPCDNKINAKIFVWIKWKILCSTSNETWDTCTTLFVNQFKFVFQSAKMFR